MQMKALRLLIGSAVLFVGCTTSNSAEEDRTAATDAQALGETDIVEAEEADDFVPETPSGVPFLQLSLEGKIDEFLAAPNSVFGENIAGDMGLSGDRRWAPWLLDLMRLGGSTGTQRSTARALQTLSGLEAKNHPIDDLVMYGTWARTEEINPGAGYRRWKETLFATVDDVYEELLADVDDELQLAGIMWGGVRRGGIPELNDPLRLEADEATFMTDEELVLGAVVDGIAVAYPLRFLARHELANDTIGSVPVSVVFCTLCRTGWVFDRRVDGRVLDFETSGLLLDSNKLMVDRQTDSLWHHLTGQAISGPLKGTTLEVMPMTTIRWSDWVAEHPDSDVLDTPTPIYFADNPERPPIAYDYTPGSAYSSYYEGNRLWFPTFETQGPFEEMEVVVTVTRPGGSVAFGLDELSDRPPFAFVIGSETLVIVPHSSGARMFVLTEGSLEHLQQVDIVDGGSLSSEVQLADGSVATRIVSGRSFWFAWSGIHPETATLPT